MRRILRSWLPVASAVMTVGGSGLSKMPRARVGALVMRSVPGIARLQLSERFGAEVVPGGLAVALGPCGLLRNDLAGCPVDDRRPVRPGRFVHPSAGVQPRGRVLGVLGVLPGPLA